MLRAPLACGCLMIAALAGLAAEAHAAPGPARFDPYKPGAFLNGRTFDMPISASFVWQAWETPSAGLGDILINGQKEHPKVHVERQELAHPNAAPDSPVLSQY